MCGSTIRAFLKKKGWCIAHQLSRHTRSRFLQVCIIARWCLFVPDHRRQDKVFRASRILQGRYSYDDCTVYPLLHPRGWSGWCRSAFPFVSRDLQSWHCLLGKWFSCKANRQLSFYSSTRGNGAGLYCPRSKVSLVVNHQWQTKNLPSRSNVRTRSPCAEYQRDVQIYFQARCSTCASPSYAQKLTILLLTLYSYHIKSKTIL